MLITKKVQNFRRNLLPSDENFWRNFCSVHKEKFCEELFHRLKWNLEQMLTVCKDDILGPINLMIDPATICINISTFLVKNLKRTTQLLFDLSLKKN